MADLLAIESLFSPAALLMVPAMPGFDNLLLMGVALPGEAGHAAGPHLPVFAQAVEPMPGTAFHVSIAVAIAADRMQTGGRRALDSMRAAERMAATG